MSEPTYATGEPATGELFTALNAFQAELVTVGKTSENPFYKSRYADLADIMKAAQPLLTKHGLLVSQLPCTMSNGRPGLRTIVGHTSGQFIADACELAVGDNSNPQVQGSAITYLRRYAYVSALGIVIDEDDDGNAARSHTATPATTQRDGSHAVTGAASPAQVRMIHALFSEQGITDRDKKLAGISKLLGVDVASTKDLSANQARQVIDALNARKEATA